MRRKANPAWRASVCYTSLEEKIFRDGLNGFGENVFGIGDTNGFLSKTKAFIFKAQTVSLNMFRLCLFMSEVIGSFGPENWKLLSVLSWTFNEKANPFQRWYGRIRTIKNLFPGRKNIIRAIEKGSSCVYFRANFSRLSRYELSSGLNRIAQGSFCAIWSWGREAV